MPSPPLINDEIETGTGKTYVYLRTIFGLARRYGFQKFIIVVPSVAIRAGVLKNIEINAEPGNEFIRFPNGRTLRLGEEISCLHDDIWHTQIKHTIRRHLDKELQVRERGIKVLSLFFIDRVASYRDCGGAGRPIQGQLPRFEAELTTLARDERYCVLTWLQEPIDKLHNG